MILQHGTSVANTENDILNTGLKPRNGKGNWFRETQHPSMENIVYLTNEIHNSEFYAARTAMISGSDCAIIQVDVPEDNLYPDENLFQKNYLYDKDEMKEMQDKVLENRSMWIESLEKRGMVGHMGIIPKERILNIRKFKIEDSPFYSYIKNCKVKNIDAFDRSFQAYMYLCNQGWFQNTKTTPVLHGLDLIKELRIYQKEKSITIYLQDNAITIE